MKVVILAGGIGSRITEESHLRPKPMIEIGGRPILWHLMKIYSHFGFNDFIICGGYKIEIIQEYFLNYHNYNRDFTIDLSNNKVEFLTKNKEDFKVTLINTGLNTNTAGRIQHIKKYVENEKNFMLTYGDGLANIDLNKLIDFHIKSKTIATLTQVQLTGRFGNMIVNKGGLVTRFQEKPKDEGIWINGGFFVLTPKIFDYLKGDMSNTQWEIGPLNEITRDGQLSAYTHNGFWKCMDAIRDKIELENIWNSGKADWKIWKD